MLDKFKKKDVRKCFTSKLIGVDTNYLVSNHLQFDSSIDGLQAFKTELCSR